MKVLSKMFFVLVIVPSLIIRGMGKLKVVKQENGEFNLLFIKTVVVPKIITITLFGRSTSSQCDAMTEETAYRLL
jgi:hypothetical protein